MRNGSWILTISTAVSMSFASAARAEDERQNSPGQPKETPPSNVEDRDIRGQRQSDSTTAPGQRRDESEIREQPVQLGVLLGPSPTIGAKVHQVRPQSAAARAGIRTGDFLVAINEETIERPDDIEPALASVERGGEARVSVWRGGQTLELTVRFDAIEQAGFQSEPTPANGNRAEGRARSTAQSPNPRSRAILGVIVTDATPAFSTPNSAAVNASSRQGAMVAGIYVEGPARKADLRTGDIIIRFDGEDVTRAVDVVNQLREKEPGEQIELVVLRAGEEVSLNAELVDREEHLRSTGGPGASGIRNPAATPSPRPGQAIPGSPQDPNRQSAPRDLPSGEQRKEDRNNRGTAPEGDDRNRPDQPKP